MSYETILYEVKDKIATITLNRPDRMNAFNRDMQLELIDALDKVDADDDVRAVVFTGSGDRAYCAGADLGAGGDTFNYEARGEDPNQLHRDNGGLLTLRIFNCTKPVIGALNGSAVGIGITMTLPMDIRLATKGSKIGFVFARRGIVPEAASSWFLPRLVGIQQALKWCYSGAVFSSEEGHDAGLFHSLHEPGEVLDAAYEIARDIADNTAPVSVSLIRAMMWRMLGADHPMESHKVDSRGVKALGAMPDAAEGVQSFLEKRPANYTGKPSTDMPDFYPWWEEPEFS